MNSNLEIFGKLTNPRYPGFGFQISNPWVSAPKTPSGFGFQSWVITHGFQTLGLGFSLGLDLWVWSWS